MRERHTSVTGMVIVFGLLLGLLAITVIAARFDLGAWSFPVAMTIAVAKALLIVVFFMNLRYSASLNRLVLAAGLFGLATLFALGLADFLTRGWPSKSQSVIERSSAE